MELIFPTIEHKKMAMDYRQEYIDCGETNIHGSGGFIHALNYETWLKKITNAQTASLRDWVDCSTYFAFEQDKIVGTIQIRHTLNDSLIKSGGHIGYGVSPSQRRKGYATQMLSLALLKCRELGIEKVLVTCDKDNIASAKTIIKCGGIFENEAFDEEEGNMVKRYWIKLYEEEMNNDNI
ncbi:MAG: GNAT family N-acetyltransferase [Oscillospiraceae bacterium]|nr:GNAT family N-acetyltransferase [Oscillospiraceae bacterium]